MSVVSSHEWSYRYLLEPGWQKGQFGRLLDEFEVLLPEELGLAEMIDLGWLRPRFRIALPVRYIKEWPLFPALGMRREIPEEHVWADYFAACWGGVARSGGPGLEGDWFQHPFDTREEPVVQELFRHTVPTGPGTRRRKPVPKRGFSRGVAPWVDAYGYWQIYEVVDILAAARLHGPIWNAPKVASRISWLGERLSELRAWSRDTLRWDRKGWQGREAAFDWLSRYRTLQGASVDSRGSRAQRKEAIARFIVSTGLTADRVKQDIRDVFEPMWRRYEKQPRVRDLVRQDIYRALDLLTRIPGERFSWKDEAWRDLGLLDEVLPLEGPVARFRFERQAPYYLQGFPSLVPGKAYDRERFAGLTERYWGVSVQFSRFCRAYDRMHQDLGGGRERGALVSLVDSTPVEHFLLCALLLEKLLASLYTQQTGRRELPSFKKLILHTVERIERSASLSGIGAKLMDGWSDRTDLKGLAANPKDPLTPLSRSSTPEAMIETAFRNFAILRNYFAHHDVLDRQLPYSDMGRTGVKSLLLVLVLSLEAS